jgi:hypothetical protein
MVRRGYADMPLTPKHVIAAVALCATAACLDITHTEYRIDSHNLIAITNSAAGGDSIECTIAATLPLADSIRTPWTGTTSVRVRRTRKAQAGTVTTDTVATGVTIDLTRDTADSLHIAIHAPFSIVLDGRVVSSPYEASGIWRCDDRIPLSGVAPGEANGAWYLSANRPIG